MLRYYCNRYEQANKQQSIGGGGNHATTLFSGCETTSLRNVDSEIAILLNYTTIQPILREIGLLSKHTWVMITYLRIKIASLREDCILCISIQNLYLQKRKRARVIAFFTSYPV
jgi:hypothetical protein